MHLSYLELTLLATVCCSLGGIFTYFLLRQKIKVLKDSLHTLDASLKGMWDTNDQWQKKYTDLENTKQLDNSPIKAKRYTLAKHASDDSIELKEPIS